MTYQTNIVINGELCLLTIDGEAFKNNRDPNQVINEALNWIRTIWHDENKWKGF